MSAPFNGDIADPRLGSITTPLNIEAWASCLEDHPDRAYVKYLLDGMKYDFRIGCNWVNSRKPAKSNMPSTREHPEVIDKYIQKELNLGRIAGPFEKGDLSVTSAHK